MRRAEVKVLEVVGLAVGHGQIASRDLQRFQKTQHVPATDHMVQHALLQQRVAGGLDPVLVRPGSDAGGEIFRQHPADRFPKMPAHQLGRRIVAPVQRGQSGHQVVTVSFLKTLRQIHVPGDQDHSARALQLLFPFEPQRHQVRLVGVEGRNLSFQGPEAPRVLFVGHGHEFLHRRGVEQVSIAAVGLELLLGGPRLGALPVHLHREGKKFPRSCQALRFHAVRLNRHGGPLLQNRPSVHHRAKECLHEPFGLLG